MDSNRLRYFLVVAETGNLRRAADLLRLSPAALSKAIKQLEAETRLKLLSPQGRGIVLTDAGEDLARESRPLVEQLYALPKNLRENSAARESTVHLRLGSFEVFTSHFLSRIVPLLPPHTKLSLHELIPGDMERALVARDIDFALTYIPIPTQGIQHEQITTLEMGIYGSQSLFEKLKKEPFETWPFVVPMSPIAGSPTKVQGLDGWPEDRLMRATPYRATLLESALELCRKSLAVAYLPSFVVHLQNESAKPKYQLVPFPAPKGLGIQKQPVYLARRKVDPESDLYRKLARALRSIQG